MNMTALIMALFLTVGALTGCQGLNQLVYGKGGYKAYWARREALRNFSEPYALVFRNAANVLVRNGFKIQSSDQDTGIIQAILDKDLTQKGRVPKLRLWDDDPSIRNYKTWVTEEVSVIVEPLQPELNKIVFQVYKSEYHETVNGATRSGDPKDDEVLLEENFLEQVHAAVAKKGGS